MTMPVNMVVRKTTGTESTPTRTICRSHSPTSNGGCTDQDIVRHSMRNQRPVCSKTRRKARPIFSKMIIDRDVARAG